MPTITIEAPNSKEKLAKIFHFLDKMGVPYRKEDISQKKPLSQKERLLRLSREKESPPGWSREALKLRREFRDDFDL